MQESPAAVRRMTAFGLASDALGCRPHLTELHAIYANFAAGTLIVLGAVITVLGFVLAASIGLVLIGLGSIATGGFISVLDRRFSR